jgi:hypothetical protein
MKHTTEEYKLLVTFKFLEGDDPVEEMAQALHNLSQDLLREGITRAERHNGLPVMVGTKRVGSLKRT